MFKIGDKVKVCRGNRDWFFSIGCVGVVESNDTELLLINFSGQGNPIGSFNTYCDGTWYVSNWKLELVSE